MNTVVNMRPFWEKMVVSRTILYWEGAQSIKREIAHGISSLSDWQLDVYFMSIWSKYSHFEGCKNFGCEREEMNTDAYIALILTKIGRFSD